MNSVSLIGRLTRDPEVRYGQASQTAVARFSIAIDRGRDRDGNDRGADFPNIVCFGKTAELVEKYLGKGRRILVEGRLKISKYKDKNGQDRDWTEVLVDNVEFADDKKKEAADPNDPFPGGEEVNPADMPF